MTERSLTEAEGVAAMQINIHVKHLMLQELLRRGDISGARLRELRSGMNEQVESQLRQRTGAKYGIGSGVTRTMVEMGKIDWVLLQLIEDGVSFSAVSSARRDVTRDADLVLDALDIIELNGVGSTQYEVFDRGMRIVRETVDMLPSRLVSRRGLLDLRANEVMSEAMIIGWIPDEYLGGQR
jgi:hypothetical protein